MSRYWNADSDLDWQFGSAPPEEAPQEEEDEPMDEQVSFKTCQYLSCLEPIGADGVIVSLRESRAGFCCLAHAAAALRRLAMLRGEQVT